MTEQPALVEGPTLSPRPAARFSAGFLGLTLLVGAAGGVGAFLVTDTLSDPGSLAQAGSLPAGNTIAAVTEAALPSVVSIEVTLDGTAVSGGSGFVIREDGFILTNNHVVADGDGTVRVLFSDGIVETGTVLATTPDYDLAVVKVERTGLPALLFGDSDALVVGDPVIAVGSPLGLDATVTTGIVSALHRPVSVGGGDDVPSFIDAIQTDAAINPGNSGGPLLNFRGEVIGITSAVAALPGATSDSGAGSVGLGFAIPSNQASRTAEELISTGHATYPVVGILLDRYYTGGGVKVVDDDPENGVVAVAPGGPGDVAGIQAGDIILSIDGRPIARAVDLVVAIRAKTAGDTVILEVKRGSKTESVSVVLASNDSIESLQPSPDSSAGN